MNNQAILSNKPLNAEFFAMLEGHVNTPVYLDDCTMINYVWMFNEYSKDWDKFDVDLVHTDAIINIRSLADIKRIAELEKDVSFYRCCALSGEIPNELSRHSSIALQLKALKEQGKCE